MPINEYLSWARGVGALITPQASYATNPAVITGVNIGIADPALYNKTAGQAATTAAALGLFINNRALVDALDDGNIAAYVTNLEAALKGYLYAGLTPLARIRLTADTTFFVGGTGANDANPGTSLLPFATLQHAASIVNSQYDTAGFTVTYQCQGAFTSGAILHAPQVGAVSAQGTIFNFASGSTVTVSNGPCFYAEFGAAYQIQGPVVLSSVGTSGIAAGFATYAVLGGSILVGDQVNFGICSSAHAFGNIIFRGPTYTISASAPMHLQVLGGGYLGYSPTTFGGRVTCTLLGTPAFSSFFAIATSGGQISAPGSAVVFTGPATGVRFFVGLGGIINTVGAGASFFPGNIAGTIDITSFGLYL